MNMESALTIKFADVKRERSFAINKDLTLSKAIRFAKSHLSYDNFTAYWIFDREGNELVMGTTQSTFFKN